MSKRARARRFTQLREGNLIMKTSIGIALAAVCALAIYSSRAAAGANLTDAVHVGEAGFSGSLEDARIAASSTDVIGCTTVSNGGAFCFAVDAGGNYKSCGTSVAEHLEVIRTIGAVSYINVAFDAQGACTYVNVENSSYSLLSEP